MKLPYESKQLLEPIPPILVAAQKFAGAEGLHFFGVSNLNVSRDFQWYQEWIDESRNGTMEWMKNHLKIRENPELLLANAQAALSFGFPYSLGDRWSLGSDDGPRIAQYARLKDYHKFLRLKLERVKRALEQHLSPAIFDWRITVDSAPLLERAIVANSGGAFVGKNTCIIHAEKGSFFLLGEILTSKEFHIPEKISAESRHTPRTKNGGCGTCKRCQVHCPTGALDEDYRIDARKCLSYWTIEHRGEIPLEYWPWISRYMFGCDICQLVCPYNRPGHPSPEAQSLEKIKSTPDLIAMILMDQRQYEELFGGTPMTRAKRSGLRRNALIAAIVTKDPRLDLHLERLKLDDDPVIRGTVLASISYFNK